MRKTQEIIQGLSSTEWSNACLSGLSVASGISSVVAFSTLIGHPVSIPLGAISLVGVSVSGVAIALTKKYQKKLMKATKLTNIVTSALAMFQTSVSKVLKNGKIDEGEFNMIQKLYYESLNDLSNVDSKMEVEIRSQLQKGLWKEVNNQRRRDVS